MNTLTFLAGMGAGIFAVLIVVLGFVVFNRRISSEQRAINALQFAQMEEGNRLRQVRADAMDRIANTLNTLENHVAYALDRFADKNP